MKKILILMIVVCTLISGCRTTERKAKEWAYSNKDKLAGWCADCFPVKPSEIIPGKPIIIPGKPIVTTDTVKVQVDCPDGTVVEADCPPNRNITIRDTILQVDTLKIRDTAMEQVLQSNVDSLEANVDSLTESRDKYRKWFWIAIAVVGGYVLIRIKKPL